MSVFKLAERKAGQSALLGSHRLLYVLGDPKVIDIDAYLLQYFFVCHGVLNGIVIEME